MPEAGTAQVHGGKLQTVNQTAKRRKNGLWLALLVLAALIVFLFAPKFLLWFGIILLVLCLGAIIKAGADLVRLSERINSTTTVGKIFSPVLAVLPVVQDFSRRLLRINPSENWRSSLRFSVYGLIGSVLIVTGWTGAQYKAARERIAAMQAAEEADKRQLANEANAKIEALVAEAEAAWRNGNSALAEEKLESASKTPNAKELSSIRQLQTRIATAKVEALVAEAEAAWRDGNSALAEEEYNADGLVLLRKTVKGTRGEFGGEIAGTVVNRRKRKLSYAQITFNLYDKNGAQVGNAIANINELEPGGKWTFKATTFGTDFSTYKFSDLSGF